MRDSAIMICYRECLSNLEKFNGGEEYTILQFINNIERIGKMIDANDKILYFMRMAKLDGEAQQELLDKNVPEPETTVPYVPYITNTVSTTNDASTTLRTPTYITVQINNKQHQAIVDTGSAVTIINQQLLKKIYHTGFIYKKQLHKSANCTSINIIGEIQLEVKIQGHKTLIIAAVATNLNTDLLLGNDWTMQNNVNIDSLQRHITIIDQNRRELATAPFVQPSNLQAELNNHFILPMLSEEENYQPKYFKSFNYKRNNTQKSGSCDPLLPEKRKVRFTDFTCETERRDEQQHQCYVCQEQFLPHNNLQQHLHQKCYPSEASLENDTINILDENALNYNDREGGHVRDEPSNEIENMSADGIQQDTKNDQNQQYINHKSLTRSQRQNRKHRAKRYRYEIIRKIYHKFTITDIKKILILVDISGCGCG
ncbi:unnamed protein product, partial [Rotaria socialis]